ncbi:hypothetical protein BBW65_05070 [Helicobacter enhydrae]|uniref:Uncharacterized protein n=1 Tax=Helicobacter enhydrae TaxID=222136 RepID=A0A1B1U630_9HELI|nr:hypothetical protein [Helicobacter enhydrae]ANV98208.1 hypothetical protein BBW65_05070 [Helicobacter enhydrae]
MKLVQDNDLRFIEGIINEDLIFGFQLFLAADKISFFDGVFLYRQRQGSISCIETFWKHPNDLIFKSYQTNCNYLLSLLDQQELIAIHPLVKRCLKSCAQAPVSCWLENPTLAKKQDLARLLPYAKLKTRLAYHFPFIAKYVQKLLRFLKNPK